MYNSIVASGKVASGDTFVITIGLPTLNSEKRISCMIESILNQTHSDFRLLISDNASTDGTNELCMQYANKDNRITVYRQSERLCMRDNFKYVLEKAETQFFSWQSDDDVLSPTWLEVTIAELQSKPDLALAFTDSNFVKDGIKKKWPRNYQLSNNRCTRIRQLLTDNRYKVWFFIGFNGLWRTDLLKDSFSHLISAYQHDTLLGTDMLLMFNAEIRQNYIFIPERLFTKRLLTDQRTYRTNYTYRERYEETQLMISQGMSYMNDVIATACIDREEKYQLQLLAKDIVERTVTNASWLRRLKWRLFPWYRRRHSNSSTDYFQ